MDLKREEAFEVGVLLVSVCEVHTLLTIQVGLNVVPLALDHNGIPVVPLKEAIALLGELVLQFGGSLLVGIQPSATGLIINTGCPGALAMFKIIVLALVTGDTAIRFAILLKGTEHATRIAGLVHELELESVDKVAVLLLSAQEGIAIDVPAKATDRSVLHFVTRRTANLFPASKVLAIEKGCESGFFKRCYI